MTSLPKHVPGSRAREEAQKLLTGEKNMLYSITAQGRIKLHRDLSKWVRRTVDKGHKEYYSEAQSPKEAQQEKEFSALISRCTKELSLDQEAAIAVKNMKTQEHLDRLAEI